jgi:cell division protein FtsI (penicillin-binding protein 3)
VKNRIIFSFVAFCFLFFLVSMKAFYLQVINSDKLITYAESQFIRNVKVYPNRGNIYDRDGNPLAINVKTYSIFTIPKKDTNYKTYKKLEKIIPNFSYKAFVKKLKKRKKFTWIARRIKLDDKHARDIKTIKNVFVEKNSSRFYPNSELGAQTIGFVGTDNIGLSGVEFSLNDKLKGEAQLIKYYKDAKGRPIKYKSTILEANARDVHLSINKDIQAAAQMYLKEAVIKHDGITGGIAVMDANTGEIWAMANYPTFDPNKWNKYKSKHRKLSFVTDPFEPGSTFKTFTVASALDHEIIKPDTNYYCEKGHLKVGDHIIREASDTKKFEWLSVEEILKYSSNIGTTKIAFDLTYPSLKETLNKLKIGQKTNIEIPGESRGILTKKKNVTPLSLSNISFGQGVATTGIQMLAAYAVIANGGYYVTPTILKRTKKASKEKVFDKDLTIKVEKMLIKAVDEGTGKRARVKHFKIAGKTSTAQRSDGKGGYSGYTSGFIGFPTNVEKRFVIYVYVTDPKKNGYYGNTVAGPVFSKVASYILYKNRDNFEMATVEKQKNTNLDQIKVKRSANRFVGAGRMPNLVGLDKSSVKKILKKLKIKASIFGFGIVSEQTPKGGEKILGANTITIRFKAPSYE